MEEAKALVPEKSARQIIPEHMVREIQEERE